MVPGATQGSGTRNELGPVPAFKEPKAIGVGRSGGWWESSSGGLEGKEENALKCYAHVGGVPTITERSAGHA